MRLVEVNPHESSTRILNSNLIRRSNWWLMAINTTRQNWFGVIVVKLLPLNIILWFF